MGLKNVHVIDPTDGMDAFEKLVKESLESQELALIVARRPCKLAAPKIEADIKAAGVCDG